MTTLGCGGESIQPLTSSATGCLIRQLDNAWAKLPDWTQPASGCEAGCSRLIQRTFTQARTCKYERTLDSRIELRAAHARRELSPFAPIAGPLARGSRPRRAYTHVRSHCQRADTHVRSRYLRARDTHTPGGAATRRASPPTPPSVRANVPCTVLLSSPTQRRRAAAPCGALALPRPTGGGSVATAPSAPLSQGGCRRSLTHAPSNGRRSAPPRWLRVLRDHRLERAALGIRHGGRRAQQYLRLRP